MIGIDTKPASIGKKCFTPEVANLLKGRTIIKNIISEAQDKATSDFRVKTSSSDSVQDYLASKIASGNSGITVSEVFDDDGVGTLVLTNPMPVSPELVTNGVLTNDGTSTLWSDVLTITGGNANLNPASKLVFSGGDYDSIYSASTLTASAKKFVFKAEGESVLSLYSRTADITAPSLTFSGYSGTLSESRPLLMTTGKGFVPYGYRYFPILESWDRTTAISAFRSNVDTSLTVSAFKAMQLQSGQGMSFDSDTGAYSFADVPSGSGAPLVLSTTTGQIYYSSPSNVGTVRRVQLALTRAQLLDLYATPIQLLSAQTGVLYMPLRFIIKQGTTRNYSGEIFCTFGTAYDANKHVAWFALGGGLATAKYSVCTATAANIVNEGQPIYITTNNYITDSSTSSTINVWLEYTELPCAMI